MARQSLLLPAKAVAGATAGHMALLGGSVALQRSSV